MPYYGSTGWAYELLDSDRDTGIQVEFAPDDDVIRFHLGSNSVTPITDAINFSIAGGYVFNTNNDAVDLQLKTVAEDYTFFIDSSENAVGFGTNDPTYFREGQVKASRFGALKADLAASNAGFFAIASSTATRGVDLAFIKCSGTWDSKGALANNDVIGEFSGEGHDGTDFNRSANIRTIVDGNVSADTVPMEWVFLTSQTNSAGLASRMRIRANGIVQFGGPRSTPQVTIDSVTGATVFNEQGNAANFRVESQPNAWTIFVNGTTGNVGIQTSAPISKFEVGGSRGLKVTTLNAATLTLTDQHEIVAVTYTATGAVTITLPSASAAWNSTDGIGRTYLIKDAGANASVNNITINRAGTDTIVTTITGDTSAVIAADGAAVRLTATSATTWMLH